MSQYSPDIYIYILSIDQNELKRGDVPKSIQCYMHETGVTEDEARQHIKFLISETWKQMNEDSKANSLFSEKFVETARNLARMGQFMYQYGDEMDMLLRIVYQRNAFQNCLLTPFRPLIKTNISSSSTSFFFFFFYV